ncbi:MAG: hypothetical protein IT534_12085 [Bauldia sp.]|nr:hypothetical protein [Bauldia sp.]
MKNWIAAIAGATAIALSFLTPASAQVTVIDGFALEAWCVGGFAGRWDKARITSAGTISATNSAIQPEPWPVVATEPALAADWIGRAIVATEAPPDTGPEIFRDAINCGLDLLRPDGSKKAVPFTDIFEALIDYVPPRGG